MYFQEDLENTPFINVDLLLIRCRSRLKSNRYVLQNVLGTTQVSTYLLNI